MLLRPLGAYNWPDLCLRHCAGFLAVVQAEVQQNAGLYAREGVARRHAVHGHCCEHRREAAVQSAVGELRFDRLRESLSPRVSRINEMMLFANEMMHNSRLITGVIAQLRPSTHSKRQNGAQS